MRHRRGDCAPIPDGYKSPSLGRALRSQIEHFVSRSVALLRRPGWLIDATDAARRILVGAPVLRFVDTSSQWNGKALAEAPLPLEKLKLVSDPVYALLKDGLIDDPRQCHFDPARDVRQSAAGNDSADCLTAAQTEAIKKSIAATSPMANRSSSGSSPQVRRSARTSHRRCPCGKSESGWAMLAGRAGKAGFARARLR
jgi:hypothetical protein